MKLYSPTQVSMYQRCGASYMFRYEEWLKVPPAGALLVGTGVHDAAKTNGAQKIHSRVDLPESDIADAAATAFDARVAAEGILPDPEVKPGEFKDETVSLARLYRREVAPAIQPVEVERRFRLTFENTAYGFMGVVDVTDEQKRVRDLKSKGKTPNDVEPHERFQLGAYAMAHEAEHGALPAACVADSLVKLRTPKAVTHAFVPTSEDVRLVLSTLAEVHTAIKAGAFPPNRSAFTCSRRQCGYWSHCEKKFGGRVRD